MSWGLDTVELGTVEDDDLEPEGFVFPQVPLRRSLNIPKQS